MAVGFAGVVLVERSEDWVPLVAECIGLTDRAEAEVEVVQQEVHLHLGVQRLRPHGRRPAQDQGGAVYRAALFKLTLQEERVSDLYGH